MAGVTRRPIDYTTIGRLETLTVAPHDRVRRWNAYLLTILYSLDPAELGLGPDDGPDPEAIRELRRLSSSTNWYGGNPSVRALRPAA
jgi:hypothetical protein